MTAGSSSTPLPTRRAPLRRPFVGLALLTFLAAPALSMQASAADFPEPRPYGGPPEEAYPERRPPPLRFEERERCRTILRRHITPEGEEIARRVTVCDEGSGRADRGRFEGEPHGEYRGPGRLLPPREIPNERFEPRDARRNDVQRDDGRRDDAPGEDTQGENGPAEDGPAPYDSGGGPRY